MKRFTPILSTILATVLIFPTITNAFSTAPYGDFQYGEKVRLQGDLSPSGVPINPATKDAYIVKTEAKVKNPITNSEFTIPELMNFSIYDEKNPELFLNKSGYPLVPATPEVITYWTKVFNGNPDYVVPNILNSQQKKWADARYEVDGENWVNLAHIFLYSGGGGGDIQKVPRNDWKYYPTNKFDFDKKTLTGEILITPFPYIRTFALDTGKVVTPQSKFLFDFSAYSVFNKQLFAYMYLNDEPIGVEIAADSSIEQGYELKINKQIPIADLNGLYDRMKEGANTLKLAVRDGYYRLTDKTITVYKGIIPNNFVAKSLAGDSSQNLLMTVTYDGEDIAPGQPIKFTGKAIIQGEENHTVNINYTFNGGWKKGETKTVNVGRLNIIPPTNGTTQAYVEVTVNPNGDYNEPFLQDNTATTTLSFGSPKVIPDTATTCGRAGTGTTYTYGKIECDEDSCRCKSVPVQTYHAINVKIVIDKFEAEWAYDQSTQKWAVAKNLPKSNVYDQDYKDFLRRVIRSGHGVEATGYIEVRGMVQTGNVDNTMAKFNSFIEDFKNKIALEGYTIQTEPRGMVEIQNNQGNSSQKMEFVSPQNIQTVYKKSYRYGDCRVLVIHEGFYQAIIPIHLTKADGNINIKGKSIPIPKERKFFTHLNMKDGIYKFIEAVRLDFSKIDENGYMGQETDAKCVSTDEYFGIKGDMFYDIHTGGSWQSKNQSSSKRWDY